MTLSVKLYTNSDFAVRLRKLNEQTMTSQFKLKTWNDLAGNYFYFRSFDNENKPSRSIDCGSYVKEFELILTNYTTILNFRALQTP